MFASIFGRAAGAEAPNVADALCPPPTDLRFIKLAERSITLELIVPASSAKTGPAALDRFELQWAVVDTSEPDTNWSTASSTLKLGRCTKGSLSSGEAYKFRARARNVGGQWGPFGATTAPLRTLLPSLPTECSEDLKLPAKALREAGASAAARAAVEAKAEAEEAEAARRARGEQIAAVEAARQRR